jgi:hypothetical protein
MRLRSSTFQGAHRFEWLNPEPAELITQMRVDDSVLALTDQLRDGAYI